MTLTVYTVPVAQPRQRHAVVTTKAGRSFLHNYTPRDHPVNAYKAALILEAKRMRAKPADGPVVMMVDFYLPRPKRLMRKKDPDGPIPHTAKPDIDNLLKSTKDALRGIAWRDDSQVCSTHARKWYAAKNDKPHVKIVLIQGAEHEEASA